MNNEGLRPLDDAASLEYGETPGELLRALSALGREQPSAGALQAARLRLEAALDGGALATHAGKSWSPLAGKLLFAALSVGAATLALRPATQAPSEHTPSTQTPSAPPIAAPAQRSSVAERPAVAPAIARATVGPTRPLASAPEAVEPSLEGIAHAPEAAPPALVTEAPRAQPLTRHAATAVARPAKSSPSPRLSARAAEGARAARAASPVSADEEHADVVRADVARAAPPELPAATETVPVTEARPARGADPELALLLEARKHAHDDPAASLRATAEHARRFPVGALAPEREVLAIRALRALGRDADADARVLRFRAAYPDSVHLSGLGQR